MTESRLPSGLTRIRWIAHCVRVMAVIAMVTVVGFQWWFWSDAAWVQRTATTDWNLTGPMQLDVMARGSAAVVNLPATLLTLYALMCLWRLFGCYLRAEVFTAPAAHHLRRLGQAVIAMAVVTPLTQTATIIALTLGNPPGKRQLIVGLSSQHYIVLLCGLVLLAMALIMREAQRMAQENAEFV
ncbi:DUF2975 domain-containing protein [Roseateles amylovorans]|uniref:DUF2975 domain-containing protein n=1 Tax=Roseateles amylovorans TaxID=2978473 RepID=A0ABY6B3X9_9BURK|nr:DUF2975 domain-containing protein [Roseateles amylovorans]UXH79639.1 DUF2975 domain-containing protein [Roseateles amylovorans]